MRIVTDNLEKLARLRRGAQGEMNEVAVAATQKVMDVAKKAKGWLYRSSITGKFVSKKYAEKNPRTTEKEERK